MNELQGLATFLPFFLHLKIHFLLDVDAVGKPQSGLLRMNLIWLGSYAECRDISNAHYCTTNLAMTVPASVSPVCSFAFVPYVQCSVNLYLEICLELKFLPDRPRWEISS